MQASRDGGAVISRRMWKGGIDLRRNTAVRGFTILEVTVCLGVVVALLSLTLPWLSAARAQGRRSQCLVHSRSAAMVHLLYASDFRDALPNAGDGNVWLTASDGESYRIGGVRGLPNGLWTLLFPDHWPAGVFDPALRCPMDPGTHRGGTSSDLFPCYWMSSAFWLSSQSLAPGSGLDDRRWACGRVGDVTDPSRKVLLFESVGFCLDDPRAAFWIRQRRTEGWRTSTAMVDGSVSRLARIDGLPAIHSMPFDATEWGVRGRDVR